MNFVNAANEVVSWMSQHWIDEIILIPTAALGIKLSSMALKQYRQDCRERREVAEMVDRFVNRPKKKIVFPPHSPRS